jgi:hypothetical protein
VHGQKPNAMTTPTHAAANASTRASSSSENSTGVIMTANCLSVSSVAQLAKSRPTSPARTASSTHSVPSCLTSRHRLPPSARRITNSLRRRSDLASIKLVKLAQATSSTSAVMPDRIISGLV